MVLPCFGFQLSILTVLYPRLLLGWGWERPVQWTGTPPPPAPRSVWVSRDLALPSRPQGFRSHVDTSSVPAPTSGGVVRSPHERLALSSEPTSGGQPLPSRSPSPGLCPDKPCLTSSVLTFPKQCLTGFVLTVFISECHACLGSVLVFLFPHQSKQG